MASAAIFSPLGSPSSTCGLHQTGSFSRSHNRMPNRFKNLIKGSKKETSLQVSAKRDSTINSHPQATSLPALRRPAPAHDPNDQPPAYSPAPDAAPSELSSNLPASASQQDAAASDDRYAFLSSFDTIFLIDDSGSMAGARWRETGDALQTITPICTAHDADGIDIFFLNHPGTHFHRNVRRASTVREIFDTVRPGGATPTGQRLHSILKPYLRRYEAQPDHTKPINIICITDGVPTDDVEGPLIAAARKLDQLEAPAWQIGVQFFQVGHDPEAKEQLKQLDDELGEIAGDVELRDIVDTVPFTGEEGTHLTGDGILKVVLGAVNRRLDRKRSKDLHR